MTGTKIVKTQSNRDSLKELSHNHPAAMYCARCGGANTTKNALCSFCTARLVHLRSTANMKNKKKLIYFQEKQDATRSSSEMAPQMGMSMPRSATPRGTVTIWCCNLSP